MTTASPQEQEPSDAELITAVRGGSTDAYAMLYGRHRAAAYNLARQLARSAAEADDLVSEAFAKLLDTLRSGGGPDAAFRAYLLTALRHGAYDRSRRDRKVEFSDDVSVFDPGVPFSDTAVAGLERSLAARAFATLPQRWQAVLWHTEIEGQAPADVAPLLGLSPNGVSALAYRAREGLRQAYLQVHLADSAAAGGGQERCQAAVDRLGAWTRDGLSKRETAQVERHLDECDRCRALAAELADVNGGLRVFVAPLVLGSATAAYLAAGGVKAAAAATVAGAAAAGSASSVGGAVAGGPRQFLTMAGSTTALVAAIVVGLFAGPIEPAAPGAAPPRSAPAPVPPGPRPPGVPPSPPSPSPESPGAPTQPPAAPAPAPNQPAAPGAPAPAPATPALEATAQTEPIELVAGGDPVSLPITVRNTGGSTSEPVVLRLNLPSGVTATGSGTMVQPGPAATPPQSAPGAASASSASSADGGVSCSGGTATIRCAAGRGLDPGERVMFVFALRAGQNAVSGQVTGSVTAGTRMDMMLPPIPVVIRLPDAVAVRAWVHQLVPWNAELYVKAIDTGRRSGQVTVTVALPEHAYVHTFWSGCRHAGAALVQCTATLAPGEDATWKLLLSASAPVWSSATVTAVLGTATASTTVPLNLRPLLPCVAPLLLCPPP